MLQTSYGDMYRRVVDAPEAPRELEDVARGRHAPRGTGPEGLDVPPRLKRMPGMEPFFEGLNGERLTQLVYVSEVAM